MKKLLYTLLATTLTLVSCNEDTNLGNAAVATGEEVVFSTCALTRGIDVKEAWDSTESVAVIVDFGNSTYSDAYEYNVTSAVGTMEAADEKIYNDGKAVQFYAFYPYEEGKDYAYYMDRMNNASSTDCLESVATIASGAVSFEFSHIYAMLTFNLTCGIEFVDMPEVTLSIQLSADATPAQLDALNEDHSVSVLVKPGSVDDDALLSIIVDENGSLYTTNLSASTVITSWESGSKYSYDIFIGTKPCYITFDPTMSATANITRSGENDEIDDIIAKFRRCLVKHTADNTVTICYLNDSNSKQYYDSSTADLTGGAGEVMVYFPAYYYKYVSNADGTFSYMISQNEIAGGVYVPESLVGAYKAYVGSNILYSRSDVEPTMGGSITDYESYAANRGTGFQLIDYTQHTTIAMMLYAKYKDRMVENYLGTGNAGVATTTGTTTTLYTSNESTNYVSGLGIEGVYSGGSEMVSGVSIVNNVWTITNPADGATREVTAPVVVSSSASYIKSIAAESGDYFDLAPTAVGATSGEYYSDAYTSDVSGSTSQNILMRSHYHNDAGSGTIDYAGVAYTHTTFTTTTTGWYAGTRLAFRGTIIEETSVSAFKALTE